MWFFRLVLRCIGVGVPRLRGLLLRMTPGVFFQRVGRYTSVYGWPTFGTYHSNIEIGSRCLIGRSVFFSAASQSAIRIGNECSLNTGCHVVAVHGIAIGNGTRIGEYCSIRDQNHRFGGADPGIVGKGFSGSEIVIGENCWIGRGVFVGPGVTIGDGAVVGANSVVVKDVPPRCLAVGAPARAIRFFEAENDGAK